MSCIGHRIHRWVLCLTAIAAGVCPTLSSAQTTGETVNATFVPVKSIDELNTTDHFLVYSQENDQRGWLLSSEKSSATSSKKLAAIATSVPQPQTISMPQSSCLWRLSFNGARTEISLLSANGTGGIATSGTNDLVITASSPKAWVFIDNGDGTFTLRNSSTSNYCLAVSDMDQYAYWGNYSRYGQSSSKLTFYRQLDGLDEVTGSAEAPADGKWVAFRADDHLADSQLRAVDYSDYELSDGQVANDPQLANFLVTTLSDGLFTLQRSDKTYLQHDLSYGNEAATWTIFNGQLCTHATPHKIVAYLPSSQTFNSLTPSDALSRQGQGITFCTLGLLPDSTVTAQGTKKLTGTWSAPQLANTDFTDVSALDLTEIALPLHASDFAYALDAHNSPIYIDHGQAAYAPESWRFVVVHHANGTDSLRKMTYLVDKEPLCIDREIGCTYATDLEYHREAYMDLKWETVCLPFAWKVASSFVAYQFAGYSNGELSFSKTSEIAAYQPVILRYDGHNNSGTFPLFIVPSDKHIAPPTEDNDGPFYGNFIDWNVGSDDCDHVYFLTQDGTTFKQVAPGSHLSPFRAYMHLTGNRSTLRVRFIDRPVDSDHDTPAVYDLRGRRLQQPSGHGIYLIGSKKVLL